MGARPDARLRPGVREYRGFRLTLDRPRRRLEVPDGAVTLMLNLEDEPLVIRAADEPRSAASHTSVLAGLHTHATLGEHSGRLTGLEVVLAPWAAFSLLGLPMYELADSIVDPGEVLGRRVRTLTEALTATPGWPERFALLDSVLLQWAATGPPCDPRVIWAWRRLVRTAGTVPVRRLATETGWTPRTLAGRFREQIGLTPKSVARVLRLRRVLRLLTEGHQPIRIAGECGFYDQAHLARDFRGMTGCTLREFRARRAAAPAAPPAPDRISGQVTSILMAT
ncbi:MULTISPECIES: helix-turn-helix domain-containing protein [unclassified Streptomyces]|uniref:helix-turn-helix domain-containing protein n=1 Tax=unclassified Streptomyces TaxID=2593676 RepID=UPI000A530206|nr:MULTISPECIES: helix-turn-helix domain-containing protein [unclassified Streptomyces]